MERPVVTRHGFLSWETLCFTAFHGRCPSWAYCYITRFPVAWTAGWCSCFTALPPSSPCRPGDLGPGRTVVASFDAVAVSSGRAAVAGFAAVAVPSYAITLATNEPNCSKYIVDNASPYTLTGSLNHLYCCR